MQYQVTQLTYPETALDEGGVLTLPDGWVPLDAITRSGTVAVLAYREATPDAPLEAEQ